MSKYSYGESSQAQLNSCTRELRIVANTVIQWVDVSIIEGLRDTERQQALFADGKSTLDGITRRSKHQPNDNGESEALDFMPYPGTQHFISIWDERPDNYKRWALHAGIWLAAGWQHGIELRWGGDWDSDGSASNQTFHDLPHIELVR